MRSSPRLLVRPALAAAALAALLLGGLIQSCTTNAVGIDACRKIESARCEALRVCPAGKPTYESDEQVDACILFYRDQCLHGIENTEKKDQEKELNDKADRCAAAVKAAAACAKAGATSLDGCAGASVQASATASELSPCDVITGKVELLAECSFVAAPPDGEGGASSASSTSASGAGGASSSSTSSSASSSSSSSAGGASSASSASSVSASSSSGAGGAGGAGPTDAGAD